MNQNTISSIIKEARRLNDAMVATLSYRRYDVRKMEFDHSAPSIHKDVDESAGGSADNQPPTTAASEDTGDADQDPEPDCRRAHELHSIPKVGDVACATVESSKGIEKIPCTRELSRQFNFYKLADSAYVRESQIVGSPRRPGQPALLPFSAPTLWRKVKAGTFPQPIKLSARVTCWKVASLRAWMAEQAAAQGVDHAL